MKLKKNVSGYLYVAAWMLTSLMVIDIVVNIIFHPPASPHAEPSAMQDYFDYGRSVEGKLDRMTRPSEVESAPRVRGGWLNSDHYKSLPNKASKPDEVLVALYGMSHTQCLWEAIQKTDEKYLIRGFMSAGATPNWSYAAYELDKGGHKADVVILGIMTEGVSQVASTTGMTVYFDINYPYTFPRYRVNDNKLIASWPPFLDAKGYIESFYSPSKWDQYRAWLAKNDKYYNSILFKKSLFDHSAFVRLLRRAYSEKVKQKITSGIKTNTGFIESSEEVVVLRTIVKTFAESARNENIIPIIYIVNLKGQSDSLFRILKPVLDAHKIQYLSTHIICPPDDPRVYLSENSHFVPSKDMELAKEMIKIIEKEIEKKKNPELVRFSYP